MIIRNRWLASSVRFFEVHLHRKKKDVDLKKYVIEHRGMLKLSLFGIFTVKQFSTA